MATWAFGEAPYGATNRVRVCRTAESKSKDEEEGEEGGGGEEERR